ncbi:MAG: GIY-YIG nuclease family protein [Chloroflexota bacterium]
MEKSQILNEIRRIAKKSNGTPPGQEKFTKESGIGVYEWYGVFWTRWSDALREAGYQPNKFNQPYDHNYLLTHLANLTRELGRFPTSGDLRLKAKNEDGFPSHNTFHKLGKKAEKIQKLHEFASETSDFDDVARICESLLVQQTPRETNFKREKGEQDDFGYVYLMKSGRFFKIGRSNSVGRRHYELSIQLPEKVTLVHEITTDDPIGIEAYWHNRFKEKRKNGEWFALSAKDVKAFKRRKFM